MKELGFLIPHVTKTKDGEDVEHDAEPRQIATPFGDRGGVVIEPWLTDQWYVNAGELSKKPIAAVKSGEIGIVPKTWEKTFFNWMENIQPWCVSRQLWWGHRIPAWFGPVIRDGRISYDFSGQVGSEIFVGADESAVAQLAETKYAALGFKRLAIFDSFEEAINSGVLGAGYEDTVALWRDQDVLDTWFSSALWPFATLGWPETPFASSEVVRPGAGVSTSLDTNGNLLNKHYPNSLLISGFDILFFWDARMMMMGYYAMGRTPVGHALPPRSRARGGRGEDVEVQGQCGRSARPDRPIRRGRLAVLHGGDGKPGPRHQDG